MQADIRIAKQLGVSGIVIGALTQRSEIDLDNYKRLIECADGLGITFHRAFDIAVILSPHLNRLSSWVVSGF